MPGAIAFVSSEALKATLRLSPPPNLPQEAQV
jgi:hypothetical protein